MNNPDILTYNNCWIVFSLIFTALITPLLVHIAKDKYDFRKKLSIVSEEIFNINGQTGMQEKIDVTNGLYSNYIYNKVTVENKSKRKQPITAISLYDIKKEVADFSDIRYDGGFYPISQKYLLLAYNNGNITGQTDFFRLKIIARKESTLEKSVIDTIEIHSRNIDSGNVISNFIIDIKKYIIVFKNDTSLRDMVLEFISENEKVNLLPIFIGFNRNTNRFENFPRGFTAPPIPNVPFFNLSQDLTTIELPCDQSIENSSNIGFTVFVEESCHLSYKLTLKSGKKKIKSSQVYKINIRVPIYKQESSQHFGVFYSIIQEVNPQIQDFRYSSSDIKSFRGDLIFDKFEAAKKYSKVVF